MKIQKIYALSLCLILFSCSGNKIKNDLMRANLRGKVKSVIEYEYEGIMKYGEVEKKRLLSKTIFSYNEAGNVTEKDEEKALIYHTVLGPIKENLTETRLFAKYTTEYDKKGNKIIYNYYCNFYPVNGLIWKIKNKYDANGLKIKGFQYWGDGGRVEAEYLYNNKDKAFDIESYELERILKLNELDNETANTVIQNLSYREGSLNRRSTFKYDEKGNEIEYINYYPNDSIAIQTTKTYDKGSNVLKDISYSFYRDGTEVDSFIHKYDIYNNKVETFEYFNNTSVANRFSYKYDKCNNEVKSYTYNSIGNLQDSVTNKYEYDKNDNWIKKTSFHYNHAIYLNTREIEYY